MAQVLSKRAVAFLLQTKSNQGRTISRLIEGFVSLSLPLSKVWTVRRDHHSVINVDMHGGKQESMSLSLERASSGCAQTTHTKILRAFFTKRDEYPCYPEDLMMI